MINQRIFLNVLDEDQKPIPGCKVKIENRKDKFEADSDYSGIVEFLVPLGVYALSLEHRLFKKKVYRMTLRDGFSFTRMILQRTSHSLKQEDFPKREPMMNFKSNANANKTYTENITNTNTDLSNIEEINKKTYEEPKKEKNNLVDENMMAADLNNIVNNFMKTDVFEGNGIFGAMGTFEGMNSTTFEDILNGAKAMLQDIMEFAENVDFDNSNYTDSTKEYEKEDINKDIINNVSESWEPERINNGKFESTHDDKTYDVYDYEEEFYEPMSGSQGE